MCAYSLYRFHCLEGLRLINKFLLYVHIIFFCNIYNTFLKHFNTSAELLYIIVTLNV